MTKTILITALFLLSGCVTESIGLASLALGGYQVSKKFEKLSLVPMASFKQEHGAKGFRFSMPLRLFKSPEEFTTDIQRMNREK